MINLTTLSKELELIDTEPLDFNLSEAFLKELELINKLTLAYPPTLCGIEKIIEAKHTTGHQPTKILDVGSGYGDTLRHISRWAAANNIPVSLTGIDLNPMAAKTAQIATPGDIKIRYITKDVFEENCQDFYHIIISSLFTHHLENQSIIKFIQWMTEHATYGWFINDHHKHAIPYYFIKYFVRLLKFNRLIVNDAPLSVARSFTRSNWESLIKEANVPCTGTTISWHCPFRYGVLCLT